VSLDRAQQLIPIVRDVIMLVAGTYVFVTEARAEARWEPMLLGMAFAAGPAVVAGAWSLWSGRTQDSGSSGSSPSAPLPPSPPSPLPSASAGEP
jgi:hypothetical protein